MNLFRSEEHVRRWPLYFRTDDDYVLPVRTWAQVFSSPLFRRRLEADYLSHGDEYIDGYRDALRATGKSMPAPARVLATVMFTDIVDSTRLAANRGDEEWRRILEGHDEIVTNQVQAFEGRAVKQTGDGFLVEFNSPARAIRCASAIARAIRDLGVEIRAGVHTGECEVRGDDLGGIAVHIGARVAALAGPGEVLVSRTVTEAAVGSGIHFESRGSHSLKGIPGEWEIHAAVL